VHTKSLRLLILPLVAMAITLGCSASSLIARAPEPTPTKTPRPTFTPTPKETPTPVVIPTQSWTTEPVVSTAEPVPTDTPLPTDTPEPVPTSVPTDTPPPPPPTDAPAPALTAPSPPTDTPTPESLPDISAAALDFKVVEISLIPAEENGGTGAEAHHNVYFSVIDANGQGLDDLLIKELTTGQTWPEYLTLLSGSKGGDRPGGAEFTLLADDYYFQIVGDKSGQSYTSEKTHCLSLVHPVLEDLVAPGYCSSVETCTEHPWHWSYRVTLQRTW
jgi:hypothetical protein